MKVIYCDGCNTILPEDDEKQLIPLAKVENLAEKLTQGSTVPVGECGECGALARRRDIPSKLIRSAVGEAHCDGQVICVDANAKVVDNKADGFWVTLKGFISYTNVADDFKDSEEKGSK